MLGGSSALPISADDDWSHVFIAMSLSSLGDPDHMRRIAQELIDRIASTRTGDGSRIRIPGHRSLARRDAAMARGTVDVDDDTFAQLQSLVPDG